MSRKLRVTALGLSMSTILFGAVFVSVSSASPVGTHTASQYKSSGLTRHDIANAQKSGMPSRLVAMAPQSNLKLVARATKVGPHALDSTIKLTVGLNLRNEIKLKSFLEQVQNPHSSVYHQWLTPGEFTRLYGPTKAEVARVEQFLKAQGINVLNVSANRVLIHTEATTAKYEHVLGIRINDYRLNGRSFYSTPDSPELPRALAPLVNGILGLNGGVRMRPHLLGKTVSIQSSQAPPPATTGAYLNQLQMAKAYDWPSLTDTSNGAGETIAILSYASVGLSMSDVHSYWSGLGLPDHDVSIVNVDGSPISGGEGETTLDLEYSGAMAPGANIILYEGDNASLTTTADVINAMLTANVADVVSTSWGLCEAEVPNISTIEPLLNQAAAQGISMSAAAGDGGSSDNRLIGGSYTCDNGSNDNADFPSSSPYVLAANGTALTISDTSGTYGSETAWPHTGGGDSNVFEQPSWQTGPGVPNSGNRMNGDMAMDAGGKGLLFYLGGAWVTNGGTSFVSPEFAGLFAVADSENGSRLGQSNELLYSDVNAGNYASDFRDVTTGSNGAFNAGPNWDYPTGWGSPKVTSLLSHIGIQGPKGTLAGTVDAAASGSALVGAKITSGIHNTESQSDGSYSLTLPAAATAQTAIASAYGYTSDSEQVVIVNGQTTTQNFNLTKAADATISGHVTDGSGHDYGLYADVTVTSANYGQQVADVWTNPTTGAYSVSVPEGDSYTLAVTPAFDGYNPGSATVTNLSGDQTENIPLTVIDSCSAPGYEFVQGGFGEDFNGSFPPPGWQVITPIAGGASWQLNTDYSQGNVTGGTGAAAMADTALTGGAYYTILQSPPIPVTSLPADPILRYKANFQAQDDSTLDLVLDGNGANTLLHWTTSHPPGSLYSLPGDNVSVDLGPYMPSSGSVLLQWQFYDFDSNAWDWYAQIDDVSIGSCQPVSGGMTYGQVTDSNTGKGLVGVNVADNVGDSTKTIQNSADPNLPAGSYLFFTPSSATALTASYGQYTPQTVPFTVQNNQVQTKNFSLKSAQFTANPTSFDLHVMVNNQATKTLTIGNTGNGAGQFNIVAINAPPPGTSSTPAEGRSAPLHLVHGHFSPTNLRSVAMQGRNFTAAREDAHTFAPASSSAAWTAIAPYPVPVVDSCSAADPATGKVYAFTGVSNGTNTASDYAYDPSSDSWSSIADFPNGGLERPVCAELNGKVYITDGDGASGPNNKLYIYDIANNSFTTGADFTGSGTEFAAAGVAFQNNFYVIGGCDGDSCSTFSKGVEVYDPSSNSWSSAANYPTDIAWQGCGVVNGALYCGGGDVSNGSDTTAAYKYDPSSDSWSQVANLLYDNWGMSAIGSNGHLLFQDGITNGTTTLTNQGQSYDAASDSWSALPNNIVATLRSDSACGFYEIGGMDAGDTFTGLASAEILPGYSSCGQNNIPWLTAAPTSATIAAGGSTNVTLTFDGTGQKEFTTSQGYLEVSGSPYPDAIIPLTVTWDPQPIDLAVGGSVSPTGTVKAGDYLAYTIAVQNLPDAAGSATQTELSYEVPANVNYIGINGATCTPPPTTAGIGRSTGGGVKPAMVEGPATVTCDLGTIEPNDSKVVTISVQATAAASSIGATFEASAREPDSDSSNNTLTLQTNPAVGPPGSAGPQGPKGSKGGGSFGWLALAALLGLALAAAAIRKGRNRA